MSDFLNNMARRAEPVRDFRPRVASRFEPAATESTSPAFEDFAGAQDSLAGARGRAESPTEAISSSLRQPAPVIVEAPSLRSVQKPYVPQVQSAAPSRQPDRNSRDQNDSTDRFDRPFVDENDNANSEAPVSRTDNGLLDIETRLQSLTARFANLSMPQMKTAEKLVQPTASPAPAAQPITSRIEVPQIVPVQGILKQSRISSTTDEARQAKERKPAAPPSPALAAWMSRPGDEFLLAEVRLRRIGTGFQLRHRADDALPPDALRELSFG